MSDTITKADHEAALAKIRAEFEARIEAIDTKKNEALDEAKKAKAELRKVKEISPDDFAALEAERDALVNKLTAAEKLAKDATKQAEQATKSLESEQGAARRFALEAELSSAIAEGNVVPALVPAFKAMIAQQAKADLVDGAYVVNIGDKAAREHIKAFLDSDEGKAFRAAPANGGSGAPGAQGNGGNVKTMSRSQFEGLDPAGRMAFAKDGGKVIDQAA